MNAFDIILLVAFFGNIAITGYKSIQIYNNKQTTKQDAPKKFYLSIGSFGLSFILWLLVFTHTITVSLSGGAGIIKMSVVLLLLTSGFMLINFFLTIAENMLYLTLGLFGGRKSRR